MAISVGNWSDLPTEILDEILTKLPDVEDFIRFGCVSCSWRSASVESKKSDKMSWGPWMMLSEPEHPHNFLDDTTVMLLTMFNQDEEEEEESHKHVPPPRKFVNLSTKKTFELYLPEAQGRRCWGSTFGWILTIGVDLNINLLNPLTRHQIPLPPQSTFEKNRRYYDEPEHLRKVFIEKFALSSHPTHHQDCVVMVICCKGATLAFAKPGDRVWTHVKCPRGLYEDVIFYNNLFYAVHHGGDVIVCDIKTSVPMGTVFMPPPFPLRHTYKCNLVEMSGDLHMVVRIYTPEETSDAYTQYTSDFIIYKLNVYQKEWIQLQDLGDHALFLGNNVAFAISTSDHPELQSNCIYFTDDYIDFFEYGYCDMGLFDFGEKKIVPFYYGDCVRSTFCTPLFLVPNLH